MINKIALGIAITLLLSGIGMFIGGIVMVTKKEYDGKDSVPAKKVVCNESFTTGKAGVKKYNVTCKFDLTYQNNTKNFSKKKSGKEIFMKEDNLEKIKYKTANPKDFVLEEEITSLTSGGIALIVIGIIFILASIFGFSQSFNK